MTVFITHMTKDKDYSKALRYGAPLTPVFSHAIHADDPPYVMHELIRKAVKVLSLYNTQRDFVLLSGAPEAIAICAGVLLRRMEPITALKWDREGEYYYPIQLDIERFPNANTQSEEPSASDPAQGNRGGTSRTPLE